MNVVDNYFDNYSQIFILPSANTEIKIFSLEVTKYVWEQPLRHFQSY